MKSFCLLTLSFVGLCAAHPAARSLAIRTANTGATGLATPKIDTHSHVYPDWYRDEVIKSGAVPGPDGNAPPPVSVFHSSSFVSSALYQTEMKPNVTAHVPSLQAWN